jgi:hypothetical protein
VAREVEWELRRELPWEAYWAEVIRERSKAARPTPFRDIFFAACRVEALNLFEQSRRNEREAVVAIRLEWKSGLTSPLIGHRRAKMPFASPFPHTEISSESSRRPHSTTNTPVTPIAIMASTTQSVQCFGKKKTGMQDFRALL